MREQIQQAVIDTLQQRSRLCADVLKIDGMMGIYTRHLLNNLVTRFCDASSSYLEVGCYRGASTMAALYGNQEIGSARSIDNFSQFDKRRSNETVARQRIEWAKQANEIPADTLLICGDSTKAESYTLAHPPAVFFYDGNHGYEHQRSALPILLDSLPKELRPAQLVYVVDDWDFPAVCGGCLHSLNTLRESGFIKVIESIQIKNNATFHDPANWWNGIGIFGITLC
jgi:hypothetical protein